jgi:hypothetical protein
MRSREVPMREGQFLPHLALKRSLFNERAVGQPGPTGEYLDIYKNWERERELTGTKPASSINRFAAKSPSLPGVEGARIDSRVSPRAAILQNE